LHAEEPAGVGRPVLQILGAKADIAQRLQAHRSSPAAITSDLAALYHVWPQQRNVSLCRERHGSGRLRYGVAAVASPPRLC
jgi:hypothetical protein